MPNMGSKSPISVRTTVSPLCPRATELGLALLEAVQHVEVVDRPRLIRMFSCEIDRALRQHDAALRERDLRDRLRHALRELRANYRTR